MTKISEIASTSTTSNPADYVEIEQAGVSKKQTVETLLATYATRGNITEANDIDLSQFGHCIMPLTQARTVTFSGLGQGQIGTVDIVGPHALSFGGDKNFISRIPFRIGSKRCLRVFNAGTSGTPDLRISDYISPEVEYIFPLTPKGEDIAEETDIDGITFTKGFVITEIITEVGISPTGATLIVDVNKDGNTICTNKPTVAISATTATISAIKTTSDFVSDAARTFASGERLSFDVDQKGSTVAGQKLTVYVRGYETP